MEYHNVPLQDWCLSATGGASPPPANQYGAQPTFACPTPTLPTAALQDYRKPVPGEAKGHKRNTPSLTSSIFSFDYLKGKDEPKIESRGLLSQEYKEGRRRYNWRAELLLGFLATASALAIIVLLVYANGRPLDSFKIPLGLVIAVLGATTRGALAFAIGACLAQEKWNWLRRRPDNLMSFKKFDEASRGPMGSIQLLYWLNLRHWATLGALVTVLLLGFDPLLQGAISYEGHLVDAHDLLPPTIPYGGRLEAGSFTPNPNAATHGMISHNNKTRFSLEDFSSIPDLNMAAAIYNGFTDAPSAVNFHCPSGNCTWPPFLSLGVCSSCHDVSDRLAKASEEATSGTVPSPSTIMLTDNYTKYSLPYVSLSNADSLHRHILSAYMAVGSTTSPGDTISHRDNDRLVAALGIIRASGTYENNQTSWAKTKVTATECALYFCIKRFEALVMEGGLKENETHMETKRVQESFGPADQTESGKFEVLREKIGAGLYNNDGGDLLRQDLQLEPADDTHLNDTDLVVPKVFNITQNAVGSMIYFIRHELFLGGSSSLIWPPYEAKQGFFQTSASQAFYNSSDLSATMKRLATGLTNWARDASSAATSPSSPDTTTRAEQRPQTQVLGTQKTWTLHVRVRWGFVVLPLATLVAGFAFVALSIRETRTLRLAPWKADVIATLAHSLDAETRAQLRFAARQGHVRQTSRELMLNFAESGHGLELKAQQQEQHQQHQQQFGSPLR
ncbi:hypothetical protein PG994_013666 [Apiospora phragmitis]|uniref:Uncharacterized protein n=1 Tax=Apiospora phragmitis TaxID=2905665 RepID=A0ABR1T9B0_9PEZI